MSCWSLIWARSASQWIEADPILFPTQHGIQRTAGVMASLWHNQKREKTHKKHASSDWFFLFYNQWTFISFSRHVGDKENTLWSNIFWSALKCPTFLRQLQKQYVMAMHYLCSALAVVKLLFFYLFLFIFLFFWGFKSGSRNPLHLNISLVSGSPVMNRPDWKKSEIIESLLRLRLKGEQVFWKLG